VLGVAAIVAIIGCGNSPVAIVNNARITESEFNSRMISAVGRDILKDMIDRELIRQAAETANIQISDEELQKEVEKAKQGFTSEEAFQQFLTSRSITEEQWLEEVRMALIARDLTLKDVTYTDADLKKFFEEHKDRYDLPVRASISEIVVATKKDADEVMGQLKQDPTKFGDLARVYSLSPYSKAQGGKRPEDMPVDRIQIDEIREAVAALPIGQISKPIKVALNGQEQWYILRVDARKPARAGNFEQDKEQIIRDYQSMYAKPLTEVIKAQAETSNVVVVDPRFQDLNEAYSTVPGNLPGFGAEPPQGGAQPPAEGAQPPAGGEQPPAGSGGQ